MPTLALVDRSTLRLSEVARHVVIPDGIVDSLWYDVVERCEEFGDSFDVWQDGLGEAILGIRDDGLFAATIGGVTMSIPRQVAKTFIVGRICVALCSLYPNLTVVWTAHRTRTATRTFQNLKGVVMRPGAIGYLQSGSNNGTAIRDANGEQAIPFANGSEILFGAREGGFGRGFDEVDIEVFDEAQNLGIKALEDMVAATNQSRFEHGALLFYMGTPPRPLDPGEAFTERRDEALRAKRAVGSGDFGPVVQSGDALFIECSADENVGRKGGPSLDDPRQVEKANPSYPHRTPPVSVKRLRKNLPGDDAWRREGLGVWDSNSVSAVFPYSRWAKLATSTPPSDGTRVLGVKFSIDGARVSVSAAVRDPAGDMVHVECIGVAPMSEGTAWLVDKVATSWRSYAAIVVDGKSGAGDFINALRAKKVPSHWIISPTPDQVITAHSGFLRAMLDSSLSHLGQPGIDAQVKSAGRRKIGQAGGWGIEPTSAGGDVVALESEIFAHWGAMTAKRRTGTRTSGEGRSSSGRRGAVVL